jgi:hypothetical protein
MELIVLRSVRYGCLRGGSVRVLARPAYYYGPTVLVLYTLLCGSSELDAGMGCVL